MAGSRDIGTIVRPPVDVVVPFAGSLAELNAVCERMSALRLRPGDTLLVVDNAPGREALNGSRPAGVSVLHAAGRRTPGFARNRGVACGSAEWLVFLDADSAPPSDLLDRYFAPAPTPRAALVVGGVIDEQVPADAPVAARYAYMRGLMSQEQTLALGEWGFPKSANIACRRAAFEAIGGFREDIRAGEDADFAYRLRAAGWQVERREGAAVVHLSRHTVRGLLKQQTLWGSGAGWLARQYPGSMPLIRNRGSLWSVVGDPLIRVAVARDRDAAIYALIRPLEALSRRLGRLLPNDRPLGGHRRRPRR